MSSATQIVRRRRRRQERKAIAQAQSRTWSIFFSALFLVLVVIPGGLAFGSAATVYLDATHNLPEFSENGVLSADANELTTSAPTQLFDRTGDRLLHTLQDPLSDGRGWVRLATLPQYVIDATLTVEDPDFMTTAYFDPGRTLLGLWQNILFTPTLADSSITGRLVRNVLLSSSGSTADIRARELSLVAELNRRYTPEQILEWHLNTNYYGSEAYGIDSAAEIYLGKRAVDLTLEEAALLVSITTATQYNPFDNLTAARGRQRDTLRVMYNANLITQESFEQANAANVQIQRNTAHLPQIAPEFLVYARRQAEQILTSAGMDGMRLVARGGLRIVTTLDVDLYYQADCALRTQLARVGGFSDPSAAGDGLPCISASLMPFSDAPMRDDGDGVPDSGSIVVLDSRTGEIRAMVGTTTVAEYQPGLTLQPIVYLEGFNGGNSLETPATMVYDVPTQFPGSEDGLIYTVANPDGRFRGVMNLRQAMGAGLMPSAAAVAYRQGMGSVLTTAHQLGINTLSDASYDLMLLERGGSVSVMDIAYAYSVFAANGHMRGVQVEPLARGYRGRDPVAILQIEDAAGNILWSYDADGAERCATFATCTILLQSGLAYLINDILADQETRWGVIGQGSPLDTSRPSAVVNGLTADRRDNWTVGYTPDYVVATHLGRADKTALTLDNFGLNGAASIWRAVIDYVHTRDGIPTSTWQRPAGVIDMRVCQRSGLLPNGVCPVITEMFMDGTQPRVQDTHWQLIQINSQTGQRATANTGSEFRTDAVYFVPPQEAMDWWRANNQPLMPEDYDTVSRPELFDSVRITSPSLFAYVGGEFEIHGALDDTNLQYYQLSYGVGLNPTQWIDIGERQTTYTENQALGLWNTRGLDGLYTLLLVAVANDNSYESEAIQVTVDNTPPTVTLDSATLGRIYRFPGDTEVELVATVQDNYAISRVEFYHDGVYLGADEAYPFGFSWRITGVGSETFSAVAFDQVGNQSNAEITVEIVRAGS